MLYVTFTQGYHFFCFYQRLVTPIVILTWANLDFALCAAPKDFIYEIIGKYYYILGELYMFIVALAVAYPYIYLARLVRSLGKFKVE